MTKICFIFQNSTCHIDNTIGGHFEKKNLGDYCVIITTRASNQRREFFTYVINIKTDWSFSGLSLQAVHLQKTP